MTPPDHDPHLPEEITEDIATPRVVTLGEVYRLVQLVNSKVEEVRSQTREIREASLEHRVDGLERFQDWVVRGVIFSGLLSFVFAVLLLIL